MRLAHIAYTGPAWKKQIKKIKISRRERRERSVVCQKQEERELWCSPQIVSPPRGSPYQLQRSQLRRCTCNILDESIIATQVTMLSISRKIENSGRGTYYTIIRSFLFSVRDVRMPCVQRICRKKKRQSVYIHDERVFISDVLGVTSSKVPGTEVILAAGASLHKTRVETATAEVKEVYEV